MTQFIGGVLVGMMLSIFLWSMELFVQVVNNHYAIRRLEKRAELMEKIREFESALGIGDPDL